MKNQQFESNSIFTRVGFEVTDKNGQKHKHFYREYHLLTPIWQSVSMESLAALERIRQNIKN